MKSLFIVSVPRSASTTLENVCAKGLGFENVGEILNSGFRRHSKIPNYTKIEEHFEKLKKYCKKNSTNKIIRDVVQPHFIVRNTEWITERFNVIFILRPIDEIMVSFKKLGWVMPKKVVLKCQTMLANIPEQKSYKHLDYYDFIRNDPNKLVSILQEWYPRCPKFEYMNAKFIKKRTKTFTSVRNAGVATQTASENKKENYRL